MDYKRFDQSIILRLDPGEEILDKIKELSLKEDIKLASVQGIGALSSFTVGLFKVDEKKFVPNSFQGNYEMVSLMGTINTMNDSFYSHLHMSAADEKGHMFGGHLSHAVISATAEIIITEIDGRVDRSYDDMTGLNIFDFTK